MTGSHSYLTAVPTAQGVGSRSPRPPRRSGRVAKPRSLVPMSTTAAAGWCASSGVSPFWSRHRRWPVWSPAQGQHWPDIAAILLQLAMSQGLLVTSNVRFIFCA